MLTDPTNDMMRRLLMDAGLQRGIRILELGCGGGVITEMLTQLVGPQGTVIGIDRDKNALELARKRMSGLGITHASFLESDLMSLPVDLEPFDAAVGRRVLMYLKNPVSVLRQVVNKLRVGGCVVFQEADATMTPASSEYLPLHARVHDWVWRTVQGEGANPDMGFQLPVIFEDAGLVVEHLRAEAVVQTDRIIHGGAALVRVMLPRILQQGVATEAEIDIETLDERLMTERKNKRATYIGDMAFGGWARKLN